MGSEKQIRLLAGVGENKNILKASKEVGFDVILTKSKEELIDKLLNKEVDGAIRGSLGALKTIDYLRKQCGHDIYRASLIELNDHKFLLAPVGIEEGDSIKDKMNTIELGAQFLLKLGIQPKIGLISCSTPEYNGKTPKIDYFNKETEILIKKMENKYFIKGYLLNEAMKDKANFILAPDGISGNLIFRSLVFLGTAKSYGAITLGLNKIFVDTSSSQTVEGYKIALKFSKYIITHV